MRAAEHDPTPFFFTCVVFIGHYENDPTCLRNIVATTTASSHLSPSQRSYGPACPCPFTPVPLCRVGNLGRCTSYVGPVSLRLLLFPVPGRKLNPDSAQDRFHWVWGYGARLTAVGCVGSHWQHVRQSRLRAVC